MVGHLRKLAVRTSAKLTVKGTAIHLLQPEDDEPEDFMEKPEGVVNLIIWALCLPLYACIYFTL